jgi:hypothetical protein
VFVLAEPARHAAATMQQRSLSSILGHFSYFDADRN